MNERFGRRRNRTAGFILGSLLTAVLFAACNRPADKGAGGASATKGSPAAGATVEGADAPAVSKPAGDVVEKGVFEDRAVESGIAFRMNFLPNEQGEHFKINLYDHGCGVVVGDYDGDGYDDVYFLNQLGSNVLYQNRGDGTFRDVTEEAGVGLGDRICVGATFADYDNDGDQDLFVTSTRGGNVLFENDGHGKYRDVTGRAGVGLVAHSATATFVDLDNDSWLDLIVTNTAKWTLETFDNEAKYYPGIADYIEFATSPKEENVVYHNHGDGTFTDITSQSGLAGKGWGGDVCAFDYNADGRIDLVITNMFGASQLYRNDGGGKFTDVTSDVLGRVSWGAIGAKAFDFNNDGRLDLFIADMHSDMWIRAAFPQSVLYGMQHADKKYPYLTGPAYLMAPADFQQYEPFMADKLRVQYDAVVFGNTFYKNLGNGQFQEISAAAGLETWWPWGVAAGDFNGDGFVDVYLPSGMGYPFTYWQNHLMMNNGDETFTEKAAALGIEPPLGGTLLPQKIGNRSAARSSRCAAVADFDGDGRLDLIVNNFNDRPYYFRNYLPKKNFIAFKLQGVASNRDAIGAVARLYVGDQIMTRQVHAAGGYLSQSSKTLHFGLGDRLEVDRAEILWPSGHEQTLAAPKINVLHHVTEPNP